MRNKLILLLAIVFAAVATFGAYTYLNDLKEAYRSSGNFANVAVAKQKIPAKAIINEQMLDFKEMPVEYIMPGTVVDLKDASGKLAKSDIYPGEVLIGSKLIGKNDPAGGLAAKLEKGKRAVAVPINNVTALHGLISPGDYIDVIVTFNVPDEEEKYVATSTIVQSVPVLAVNKTTDVTNGIKDELQTATLMVEPAEAQQIVLAVQQGSIQLVLRSPEDKDKNTLSMTKLEHLKR
jgi:pilus assembly protein CpaB